MFTYLLLLPLVLSKPFIGFNDLLKNMTFDKVHTNDHTNQLVIDYWSDDYCQDYVHDSEYLPVQQCFCDEEGGGFCGYIEECSYDFVTLYLFHYMFDSNYKCHEDYYYESMHIPTNVCDERTNMWCMDPDTHNDDSDDSGNTENSYDYIERREYRNDNCNGNPRYSEDFQINECKCNEEEGWCVYPLYCNNEFIEVELYGGNSCNRNDYETLRFAPNTCFDQQEFICHHDDDDIHPVVATILGIASTLFCCCIFILLLRCCFVQNPFGRSQPAQPVVQMVPQNQLPQIMVQQPQMVQRPQMNHLNPHPNQQHQMVIQQPIPINLLPAVQASAPGAGEGPLPAYTYPHLNDESAV
jgi:hypothetical protein